MAFGQVDRIRETARRRRVTNLPRLDGDDRTNERIHALLRHLNPADVALFVRKFSTEPRTQRIHTYRELLFGVHLRDNGFDARYERRLGTKTPDWTLVDKSDNPLEIVDVTTLHQKLEKDLEIGNALRDKRLWSGWITVPSDHVYSKLETKINTYATHAAVAGMPFVVAAFGEFRASLDPQEVQHVLFVHHGGLLATSPELSGVVYFREVNCEYEYTYFQNAHAMHQSALFRATT